MFESFGNGKSLDEDLFDEWLEKGRENKIGYQFMLVTWTVQDEDFKPIYFLNREDLMSFRADGIQEKAIAAYDLFSESRIMLED